MPPKRRTRQKAREDEESEDTDTNVPVKVTRRSSRRKQTIKSPTERNKTSCTDYDYDADCENNKGKFDLKCLYVSSSDAISDDDIKHIPTKRNFADLNSDKRKVEEQEYTKIKDFTIRLSNVHSSKWSSSIDSDSSSDGNKINYKKDMYNKSDDYSKKHSCKTKKAALQAFMKNPKNKENVTPPESHSTPALMKLMARNLDDSLFGFDTMNSPLPFSPVVGSVPHTEISSPLQFSAPALTFTSSITSPYKRKHEKETGFFDFPIEAPKKRQKKKKNVKKSPKIEKDVLEDLRCYFEEVEMHELVIE